jgi:hypothetical protein
MIIYNTAGLLGVLLTGLLAAGVILGGRQCGLNVAVEEFFLVWSAFLSTFGLLYDRTPRGRAWRSYRNCFDQFEARIALFGFPVLAAPVVALIFSWITCLRDSSVRPSASYFLALTGIAVVMFGLAVITLPLRTLPRREIKVEARPDKTARIGVAAPPASQPHETSPADQYPGAVARTPAPPPLTRLTPKGESDQPSPADGAPSSVRDYERRSQRARTWFWLFLSLMPIGCISPIPILLLIPSEIGGMAAFGAGMLFFVGVAGAVLLWRDRGKYRHAILFLKQGKSLGLQITQRPRPSQYAFLRSLEVLSWAKKDGAERLLSGVVAGFPLLVVEYQTDSSSQTVIALPDAVPGVANFVLHSKPLLSAFSLWLPREWIELPAFGERFVLAGPKLEKIGAYFTPEVVRLCLLDPGLIMEIKDSHLVLIRRGLASPTEYPRLLSLATRLAKALRNARR